MAMFQSRSSTQQQTQAYCRTLDAILASMGDFVKDAHSVVNDFSQSLKKASPSKVTDYWQKYGMSFLHPAQSIEPAFHPRIPSATHLAQPVA